MRLGLYFGNRPQFWLGLQSQYEIALIEQERGSAIVRQVRRPTGVGVRLPAPRLAAYRSRSKRCVYFRITLPGRCPAE